MQHGPALKDLLSVGGERHKPNTRGAVMEVRRCTETRVVNST